MPTTQHPVALMTSSPDWQRLPHDERERLRAWVVGLDSVARPGVTRQLQALAARMDASYATARRYYSAWTSSGGDWQVLADGRLLRAARRDGTGHPDFIAHVRRLIEGNQRSTAAAVRQLKRQWRAKEPIPGYPDWPGWPRIPVGWTERNLRRYAPTRGELTASRIGIRAAKKSLPQTFRTRVGLWPGSHIQMDDVWHDHYVRYGDDVTRVLEFGALDVYSACRFAWGTKPRMPKTAGSRAGIDGGHIGLTDREFRLFFAGTLWTHGYSPQGTTYMLEHATASLPDRIVDLLHDATGGLIQCKAGGLTGEQQAVLGLWGGRPAGHGNFKSALESLHALMHSELAALPGQTGKDRTHLPESTYGLVRYQERLLKWAADQPPEIREALRHPLLDYQTQFLPLLHHVYGSAINGRTEHRLEGWEKLGHIALEYTLDPDSDHWLPIDALPDASRGLVLATAKSDPVRWSRRRRLSPGEVWGSGRADLLRANAAIIADIIGPDEAHERTVRGAYIRFQDSEIDPDELIYESRIVRPDGREEELRDGETYACLANPYAPDQLIVLDARGRCLGVARRVQRVRHGDTEALQSAWGRNNHRQAQILAPQRQRWETDADAARDLRTTNAGLGFPGGGGSNARPRSDDGRREARDLARAEAAAHAPRTDAPPEEVEDIWDDADCPFH